MIYQRELANDKRRVKKPTTLEITPDHLEQLQARKEENIRLLLNWKSTGVEKNINYLRKAGRENERIWEGTIYRFFASQNGDMNERGNEDQENP